MNRAGMTRAGMSEAAPPIVVAGHVCLDVIPAFPQADRAAGLVPGGLVEVGPPTFAAGGVVSNTGVALHRLGLAVRLVGKVGDDFFGEALLGLLRRHDAALAGGMVVAHGEHTSYTIVLSPPGVDRSFLHHTGANATFGAADVPADRLDGARFFHFGYPPLMPRLYRDGGAEMAALFGQARAKGLLTSLDMARPDPATEAGRVDWPAWLARVLPHVDLFAPSLDELLVMLRRPADAGDAACCGELAAGLLGLGTAVVALKLGDRGLYLRTTPDAGRLPPWLPAAWAGRELLAPCFAVEVAGTTGAGDCTVAGLLAALAFGAPPEEAVTLATAVGACSVERPDSTSGIPALASVRRRIASGWPRRATPPLPEGWTWDAGLALASGPARS